MSFPTKVERQKCWGARDKYWECLDTTLNEKEKESQCQEYRKLFEANCSAQWVKHFDRKRNYMQFKEKIEKEGIPTKHNKCEVGLPRRVYQKIVAVF